MKKLPELPVWVVDYNHYAESIRIPGRFNIETITNVPPKKIRKSKAKVSKNPGLRQKKTK